MFSSNKRELLRAVNDAASRAAADPLRTQHERLIHFGGALLAIADEQADGGDHDSAHQLRRLSAQLRTF